MKKQGKKDVRLRVINFVLDETGSMGSCKDATISGFNEYFKSLRDDAGWKTLVTLTKFNSAKMETAYRLEDVKNVQPLNQDNYRPDACTPLYDAIGRTIRETEREIESAKDRPAVICVILTDGQENASREYSLEAIRCLIEVKKRDGWKIVCLGADIDAWSIGRVIGLDRGDTVFYEKAHTDRTFRNLAATTKAYFDGGADAKKDFFGNSRGKKSKK